MITRSWSGHSVCKQCNFLGVIITFITACSLVDHANSDDDRTLAGSSPIKSLSITRLLHSPDACYNSSILHQDNTLPRLCQRVHHIVYDLDEGPVLKRARTDDVIGDDEGPVQMGPEPEIIDAGQEDTQEGSPGDKGEGRIEDNPDIADDEEEGRDEEMEGSSDAGDAGDSDLNSDYNLGAVAAHALLPGECKRKGHKKREKSSRRKRVGNAKWRGRGRKGRPNWTNSTTLPPPTTNSLQLLARLYHRNKNLYRLCIGSLCY